MSYRVEVLADNPLAYWRLGESNNLDPAADETLNGRDGTYETSVQVGQPGVIRYDDDTCIRLAASLAFVTLGDQFEFNFGDGVTDQAFSLEAWCSITSLNTIDDNALLNKDQNANNRREWNLFVGTDRTVSFAIVGTPNREAIITTTSPLSDPLLGERYHIVATYDGRGGDEAADGMEIYVNGFQQAVTRVTDSSYVAMSPTQAEPRIGVNASGLYFLDALVDEVAIYGYQLPANRIEIHALTGHYAGFGQTEHNIRQVVIFARVPIIEHNIIQTSGPLYGAVRHDIRQSVVSFSQEEHPIQQELHGWLGQVEHNIKQAVTIYGQVEHNITQTVYNPATLSDNSKSWRAIITLDGTDITSQLTGGVRVVAEEGTARTANFLLFPPPGPIQPQDYVGKRAVIIYEDVNGVRFLLFDGIVDTPVYDPIASILTLNCTDQYQELLANMAKPDIDALIGGKWSKEVFREDTDNYQYALNRLKTVRGSLDMTVGRVFKLADWDVENKTPDFSVTSSDVFDQSTQLRLIDRRDLRTRIVLTVQHRFQRLYHRERYLGWSYPRQWCEYLKRSTDVPTRDMVASAINSSGWMLSGNINFTRLPPSGPYQCDQSTYFFSNPFPDALIHGFSATVVRRWTQTLTGSYVFHIDGTSTVSAILPMDVNQAISTPYNPSNWESQANSPTGTIIDGRWGSGVSVVGVNVVTYEPPILSTRNSWKDWILDEDNRAEADTAIETWIAIQRKELITRHRQNYVSWKMPIKPTLERHHVVSLNSYNVAAKGKVYRYEHLLDIINGEASTQCQIAMSLIHGAQTADSPVVVPDVPDLTPPLPPGGITEHFQGLTQLGGDSQSPPHDPNKAGFSGNYAIKAGGSEIYPYQYLIIIPEIEDEFRDEATWNILSTILTRIPNDPLILQAS